MRKQNENNVILYQDENGITRVTVRFSNDDLWLTQNQIVEIYDTTQPNISQHIEGIFKDGELDTEATNKKFLLVQTEGKRQVKREIGHYNLEQIAMLNRTILAGPGKVSHTQAMKKAEKEFETYRAREIKQMESDFDRAVKAIEKVAKKGGGDE